MNIEQAGFRQHRSCPDQIARLRIVIEQSFVWIIHWIWISSTMKRLPTALTGKCYGKLWSTTV